jgi:hypothetical protein
MATLSRLLKHWKSWRALEIPLYQLFYDGEEPPKLPNLLKRNSPDDTAWGSTGKEARYLNKLRRLLGKRKKGIASYFSTWPRKCLIGSSKTLPNTILHLTVTSSPEDLLSTTSAKLVFPDPGDAAKKTRGIGAREELRQALCLR